MGRPQLSDDVIKEREALMVEKQRLRDEKK
jgi:hypothetical protein